ALRELVCTNNPLTSLRGLENAISLQCLHCDASLGVNADQWENARRQIVSTICKIVVDFHCILHPYAALELTEYCAHVRHFSDHWRIQKINALRTSMRELN